MTESKFVKGLVGEDHEANLRKIDRKQNGMLAKEFSPIEELGGRKIRNVVDLIKSSAADYANVSNWEEYDELKPAASENILDLTEAFAQMIKNLSMMGRGTDPIMLRDLRREFTSRLNRIKLKQKSQTIGESILNSPDDALIRRILEKTGHGKNVINYILS